MPRSKRGGCDTIRAVSAAGADRPGRNGRGLQGLRYPDRPHRRAQVTADAPRQGHRLPAAFPARVTGRRGHQRTTCGADPRLRRDRRAPLSGHAADRRQQPRRAARRGRQQEAAEAGDGGVDHRAGGRGAGRRARTRPDPPRRQAVEHPGHQERLRLPDRLRAGAHRRPARPDDGGQHARHDGLHVARAVRGRRDRSALGRLRADVRALRMPDGAEAVSRRQPRAADRQTHQCARAEAVGHRSEAGRIRRGHRQGHVQEAGQALSVGGRDGRRRAPRVGCPGADDGPLGSPFRESHQDDVASRRGVHEDVGDSERRGAVGRGAGVRGVAVLGRRRRQRIGRADVDVGAAGSVRRLGADWCPRSPRRFRPISRSPAG